jgi:DNA-binding LacI/PurR family transcriptional regulator
VVRAADKPGLDVPRDLSVVGCDDGPLARRLRPQLTTVRQAVAEKGRASATELARVLEVKRAGTKTRAKHLVLPTELVVRDSTAPPPSR